MKSAHDGADPEVRRLIGLLADNGPDATAEELRASFRAFVQEVEAGGSERANVAVVYDTQVPGPDGPIKVRVFEPKATSKATDDCLVYFHGGGFVVGDIETSDLGARALAAGLDLRVVSVDYRLAPEHPFPAPFDDCLAVLRAVRVETTGAVYVGGESAGANLSAALALICRDTGLSLAGQILVNPGLDFKIDSPSHSRLGQGEGLTSEAVAKFFELYRGATDPYDPRISPLYAERHDGLAPCFMVTAGFDPLRDDGAGYAKRLIDSGVMTVYLEMPTMMHGWWTLLTTSVAAKRELERMLMLIAGFLAITRAASALPDR